MNIPRSSDVNTIVTTDGVIDYQDFLKEYHIDGIIRIQKEDYDSLRDERLLTHFNLQHSGHKVGSVYALPLIVKPGFYTSKEEIQPILSFTGCMIAECTGVRENVKYDELGDEVFENSFPNIKTVAELKAVMVRRYGTSIPELSEEKLLSLGVSVTELKVVRRLEAKS